MFVGFRGGYLTRISDDLLVAVRVTRRSLRRSELRVPRCVPRAHYVLRASPTSPQHRAAGRNEPLPGRTQHDVSGAVHGVTGDGRACWWRVRNRRPGNGLTFMPERAEELRRQHHSPAPGRIRSRDSLTVASLRRAAKRPFRTELALVLTKCPCLCGRALRSAERADDIGPMCASEPRREGITGAVILQGCPGRIASQCSTISANRNDLPGLGLVGPPRTASLDGVRTWA